VNECDRRGAPRRPRAVTPPADAVARRPQIAVVAARFNEPITKRLLDGALHALDASGVAARDLEVHWVPGAFELRRRRCTWRARAASPPSSASAA